MAIINYANYDIKGTLTVDGASTFGKQLTVSSSIGGDSSWDDSGILIENTSTSTGEPTLAFRNAGVSGTGSSYWFTGLNQSATYKIAYGGGFTDANTKFELNTGGLLRLNSYTQGFLQTDSNGNVSTSGGGTLPGGPYLPLSAGSTKKLTDTLYIQGTNQTGAESVLLRGISSDDADWLGSIRTNNTGGYNQSMKFYTSDANGTSNENLALTLTHAQNATFAGNISAGFGTFSAFVYAEDEIHLTDAGTTRAKLLLNSSDRDNVELRAESLGSTMKFFTVGTEALLLDASQDASFAGNADLAGRLKVGNYWNDSTLSLNSIYAQNSTDGFAFGVGTGISTWFSYSNTAGVNRMIDIDNDGTYIKLRTGNVDRVTVTASGATFLGNVALGGTGQYTTNQSLNIDGTGLAIKNNVNGSSNNWSYIHNTATASSSNLVFATGTALTALTLAHSGAATFSGLVSGIAPTSDLNFATKKYVDDSITGGANYLGTWDPDDSLNSGYGNPSLEASGRTDDSGDYFICSADGAAHPNGGTSEPDSWNTGDWVIWNEDLGTGGLWQKLDNTTVLSGGGTTNSVAKFTDNETIGDGPIAFTGNDSYFDGEVRAANWLVTNKTGASTTTQEAGIRFTYNNVAQYYFYTDNSDDGNLRLQSVGVSGESDATPRLIIPRLNSNILLGMSGGNVGIGTDDPQNALHIKKEGYQLKLEDGNTTNTCEILASNNTMGFFSDRANAVANSDMIFSIDNDTKMIIDTNGSIGINTTDPVTAAVGLTLDGSSPFIGFNTQADYDATVSRFTRMISDGNSINFFTSNTTNGTLGAPTLSLNTIANEGVRVGIFTNAPQELVHIKAINETATVEIQGGLTSITAEDQVHAEINFGANDSSVTGGIAGSIKSVSEYSNGAHAGLAFHTGQQSRTPYLQLAMQIRHTGAIAFGSNTEDYGSAGEILVSNGNASPTWDAASTVIGGPYLPLAGGTMTGNITLPGEENNTFKIGFTGASATSGLSTVDQSGAGLYIGANSKLNNSGVVVYNNSALPSSGIYFDGWSGDNMEFYTGSSGNPTKRLTIEAGGDAIFTGNVGIGDISPSFPLVISKSSSTSSMGADLSMRLGLTNPDQTNNNLALITFGDGTSEPGSGFFGMQFTDHTNDYGELVFGTRGVVGYGEKMRIDSEGNVGIGTTSPDAKLDIEAAINPTIRLTNSTNPLGGADVGTLEFFTKDTSSQASRVLSSIVCVNEANSPSVPDGQLAFKTSLGGANAQPATEKMRIDPEGNVGIGTISPDGKLDISESSGPTSLYMNNLDTAQTDTGDVQNQIIMKGLYWSGSGTSQLIETRINSVHQLPNGNGGSALTFMTQTGGSGVVEQMRIDKDGNVGIGTTSPDYKLDVTGNIYSSGQMLTKGASMASFTVLGDLDTGLGNFDGKGRVSLVSDNKAEITVDKGTIAFDNYTATAVATTGSLIPNQSNQAVTEDTLALLAVDPEGNVVRGSQEGTWTFTKAQLDALATTTSGGTQLIQAPGANKAVVVEESNWMVKYSGTGSMSQNGFEIRQPTVVLADAGISRIPSGQINNIMSSAQGTPTNPSYGFYARDLPQYNNDGRTYKTNAQTVLMRINTNATPANLVSISIKLKYRLFDATTF